MSLAPRVWSAALLALTLALSTACTKRNPDLCCATDAECTAIGFSSHAPCDLGVCVKNECTTAPGACDDDADCAANAAAPFCVAGTCAACASSASCPASAPVCDATAHDCRACVKDSECDSLACEISAGTCVDPANILYVSPNGATSDPCTRTAPCALSDAAQEVDTGHPYIVLLPGNHFSGASFDGKTVTIAGNGATLEQRDSTASTVIISNSTVVIRDIHIEENLTSNPGNDGTAVIVSANSKIDINNLTSHTTLLLAIMAFGHDVITLSNSKLTGFSIATTDGGDGSPSIVIDRCSLDSGLFVKGFLQLTNSIIATDPSSIGISISDGTPFTRGDSIYGNTFIGGQIRCEDTNAIFDGNIFFNANINNMLTSCYYSYNLFSSANTVSVDTNLVGDPQFVDAANHDYHLTADSPARDAGQPGLTMFAHDFDGTPRPQGPRNDLGAFEYVPPATH